MLELEDRPDELYLALIEVCPPWQGKGLGGGILRWLGRCSERSNKPLALHVLRVNQRAVELYERAGLRVVDAE